MDYFEIGNQIESRLRELFAKEIKLICSPFTENDPKELQKHPISLHIVPLPSELGNSVGNGKAQTETQHWQVVLCYAAPKNAQEVQMMRENVGEKMLRLRQGLQGLEVSFLGGSTFLKLVSGTRFDMTADCRFRLFSCTFAATIKV